MAIIVATIIILRINKNLCCKNNLEYLTEIKKSLGINISCNHLVAAINVVNSQPNNLKNFEDENEPKSSNDFISQEEISDEKL